MIENVRKAAEQTNRPVAIMLDTKGTLCLFHEENYYSNKPLITPDALGPEIRTGKLRNGATVELKAGQPFSFTTDTSYLGDENGVACTYAKLAEVTLLPFII